jgi:ADP-heptose:LPS heptosyltransferase
LTLVVFDKFRDAATRLPMVDDVIGFDVDSLSARLDARRGDLPTAYGYIRSFLRHPLLQKVDDLYNLSHTPLSATLCRLMRPANTFGMQCTPSGRTTVRGEWFNYLLSVMSNRRLNPFNLSEIYLRMNGQGGDHSGLEFTITEDDRSAARALLEAAGIGMNERYVVLQPGASSASRQWPAASFADLARRLANAKYRAVITGSVSEETLAAQIAANSAQNAVSLAGKTNVGTLTAVLEGAERVISNDTGTIHLSAAVQTPAIGIYLGPASAKDTAPYGDGHIILEADEPCAPCDYQHHCRDYACHRAISPETVFALIVNAGTSLPQVKGARVHRTSLTANGTFRLARLNQPETGHDDALLALYRTLWDALLDGPSPEHDVLLAECSEGLDDLRSILAQAQQSSDAIRREALKPDSDRDRLTALLKGQSVWHNALCEIIASHPDLSPLPRFLLVRASALHADTLKGYLEDLRITMRLFRRGVEILESVCKLSQPSRSSYAVAE